MKSNYAVYNTVHVYNIQTFGVNMNVKLNTIQNTFSHAIHIQVTSFSKAILLLYVLDFDLKVIY